MLLLDVPRFILGALLLAWLPGYAWTRVLLPALGRVERHVYAVALSVASLTLLLYLGNVLLDIPIGPVTGVLEALLLTAAALAVPLARTLRARLDRWTS